MFFYKLTHKAMLEFMTTSTNNREEGLSSFSWTEHEEQDKLYEWDVTGKTWAAARWHFDGLSRFHWELWPTESSVKKKFFFPKTMLLKLCMKSSFH